MSCMRLSQVQFLVLYMDPRAHQELHKKQEKNSDEHSWYAPSQREQKQKHYFTHSV